MNSNTVFIKTPKGLEEIEKRSFRLEHNLRFALIMIDGRSSVANLSEKYKKFGEIQNILTMLETQGFIVAQSSTAVDDSLQKPSLPASASIPHSGKEAGERLNEIKTDVDRLIRQYFGLMVGPLLNQLNDCKNLEAVFSHASHCRMLIQNSFSEKKADAFWESLKKLIP